MGRDAYLISRPRALSDLGLFRVTTILLLILSISTCVFFSSALGEIGFITVAGAAAGVESRRSISTSLERRTMDAIMSWAENRGWRQTRRRVMGDN